MTVGTVIWTSPTGKTYKTLPGSRIFFPAWDTTTAKLAHVSNPGPASPRGIMMPRRRRTRAADGARRLQRERALNAACIAQHTPNAVTERNRTPPPSDIWDIDLTTVACDDDPPPF
jgi:hypothetical protein